jgi:DNA-binding NarL/FixJ family response regulator
VRNEIHESRSLTKTSSDGSMETQRSSRTNETVEVPVEMLTALERQIVQMLAHAKSNKEIADALSMTVKAVEVRRAAIMCTLKVNSVLELVQYALRMKLVETKSK